MSIDRDRMKKSKIIMFLFFILMLGIFIVTNVSIVNGQMTNKNLFSIKRNKNANVVMYDIRLDSNGNIDELNPIDAYWILYDEQGQRSEIKAFEKKAYGFMIKYNIEGYYDLTLRAVPDRSMKIILLNGEPKVVIKINNEDAYLSTVFVFARDNLIIPKVLYYTITGFDIKTRSQITEKIVMH
ncbi:MAG: hypothetical protein Nk1A_5270 [Endomicrobiia bacterium]|nr:MAG: hypothetical protein Nk1A_5270 [Endomicrobiia bacterium]